MGADRPVTVTAVADGVPTQEDAQAMLRTLPAQRFKLVVREEKREMAVTRSRPAAAIGNPDGSWPPSPLTESVA